MAFRLPKACRTFFNEVVTTGSTGRNEENKFLWFDAYYLCLLVGLAKKKISSDPSLLDSEFIDYYPDSYVASRDYIAGLLIATELERQNIVKEDAGSLQRLMLDYVDYESPTRLSKSGMDTLNQYAARGMEVMQDMMSGKPTNLEILLREYFMLFETGEFF